MDTAAISGSILDYALTVTNYQYIYTGSATTDLPDMAKYAIAKIYGRADRRFISIEGNDNKLHLNSYNGSTWKGWETCITNTDLGIVYHPNINIPSTKTAIENYIKTNLGTLKRFNTVRSDPAAGSESGIFPGGTSFCILWQCSSAAYGWVTLYSDLIGKPIVYGIINGTFTWYTPNLTQI